MAKSADPDQLASEEEANWSGSTLFERQGIFGFSRLSTAFVKSKKNMYLDASLI